VSEEDLHPASVMEAIADAQPEAPALRSGGVTRSWSEFENRAARFASALAAAGIERFAGVGLYLRNSNEYLEAHHGIYKARCVPVNVNYRYLEDELAYLLRDAGCEALVFHSDLADRVERVHPRVPGLKLLVRVNDGPPSGCAGFEYEALLAAHEPAARVRRSGDDPYLFYTGGTTGMPKGMAMTVGARLSEPAVRIGAVSLGVIGEPTAYGPVIARALRDRGENVVSFPVAPLMHSTAMNASAIPTLLFGGCVVTSSAGKFVPDEVLGVAADCDVTTMTVGGDAMAKPLLLALEAAAAEGRPHDLSRLRVISSAGMAWSQEVKRGLFRQLPEVELVELYGSTEGLAAMSRVRARDALGPVPTFEPVPGMKLLREDGTEVAAGTEEAGLVAFPVADEEHYHDDATKTAEVFRWIEGVRYAVPGDWGVIEPDGALRPIGRGAKVINSGGEKIFTEEVEGAIRELPDVIDCLVIGVPHERWGEQVTALVARVPGAQLSGDDVRAAVRATLADYKAPKRVTFVDEVPRHANSKADFVAARGIVAAAELADV
jgi:acyl-CoA synthetase (AMP-forming)/AMP-acid ligase II